MMETVSLRDVSLGLGRLQGAEKKIARGPLLGLLRSGELKGGFFFPISGHNLWTPIPQAYWTRVTEAKLKVLTIRKDSARSGSFTVFLTDFADEVIKQLQAQGSNGVIAPDAYKALFSIARDPFEVLVSKADWEQYLARNPLPRPSEPAARGGGRNEKPSWRQLSILIGAFVLQRARSSAHKPIKPEYDADAIYTLAKDRGIVDPPAASTIKDVLSEIVKQAKQISID